MRRAPLIAALLLALPMALCARAEEAFAWDRYKVLSERNMFLPVRSRPAPPRSTHVVTFRPRTSVVLRGTVCGNGSSVAFFEDTRSGVTTRVAAGGELADGRVTAIAPDHVTYVRDNETSRVDIGGSLLGPPTTGPSNEPAAGTQSAPASPSSASSATSTTAAPSSPAAGGTDANSILERLRQRREQEMKKK